MARIQSRESDLADRVILRIENTPPQERKFLQFGKIVGSLIRADDSPRLDHWQFTALVKEVQRIAMSRKGKRYLVYQTLPLFVQRRYDRAAKGKPRRRQVASESLKFHMALFRPGVDDHPERGYDYGDQNKGFVHNYNSPYPEEAPC